MLVRYLALVCLLPAGATLAHSASPARDSVAVYLKTDLSPSSPALSQIKAELVTIMAAADVRIQWTDARTTGGFPGELIVLRLNGNCELSRNAPAGPPLQNMTSLASTASAEGEILPFSSVDCDALAKFVGNALNDAPALRHRLLYNRAIARLAGHELYHVLSKRPEHPDKGIAKAAFSLHDLLFDNSFTFERPFVEHTSLYPVSQSGTTPRSGGVDGPPTGR